jgi:hypothetical protein
VALGLANPKGKSTCSIHKNIPVLERKPFYRTEQKAISLKKTKVEPEMAANRRSISQAIPETEETCTPFSNLKIQQAK